MSKSSTKSKSKAKAPKTAKAKTPKTTKPAKAKTPTGLGNPTAKKSMNPQRTLDLKAAAVKEAGGKMAYAGRKWVITTKGGTVRELLSRELAAMTVKELVSLV